jgi:hypothetical protein
MTENTGFAAFAMFHALKLHFTGSYDYVKYNGKTNVSKQSFSIRKDKFTFYRLSRKYSLDELRNYYISNFIVQHVNWVGDITGPDNEENYKNWQKRIQSLTYQFESDIIHVLDNHNNIFKVESGNYPKLLVETMHGKVAIETLVILNDLLNFFPVWEKKIIDDIVWPELKNKCEKYKPFLFYDKNKMKNILQEKIKDYAVS